MPMCSRGGSWHSSNCNKYPTVISIFGRTKEKYYLFMPPPFVECGRALSVAHVRACVRACIRASFCASVRPSFKWVLCERNSSCNFIPILLKLYRCFCQGLKMCMTFGYNPQINFCHFFHSLNLVIFGQLLLQFNIRIMLL